MPSPSYTYTLTNGTTADASQVMQDFNDILNGVTDGTKDLSISALTCAGTATFNGNVNIGNASADDLTITASLASSIPIKTTNSYDIGSATLGLRYIFIGNAGGSTTQKISGPASVSSSATYVIPDVGTTGNFLIASAGTSGQFLRSQGTAVPIWDTLDALVATSASNAGSTTTPFKNTTEVTDTASAHNTTTGIFTAPAAGTYLIVASAFTGGSFSGKIYLNGSIICQGTIGSSSGPSLAVCVRVLAANDTVEYRPDASVTANGDANLNFLHVVQIF